MANTFQYIVTAALKAFKENFLTSRPITGEVEFAEFQARRVRYDIAWASYESTQYRQIHAWSLAMKEQYKLYTHIRPIYNPSTRIANFYKQNVWRGILDADAGEKGAIPLVITSGKEDAIRKALSKLYIDSNMAVLKDILVLWGAVFGDVGIKVVDDVVNGRVYLERVMPSKIKSVEKDSRGYVRSYELEENVLFTDGKTVKYTERGTKQIGGVLFETFKDDVPFGWNGNPASWTTPYAFVPFIHIQHENVGLKFGWAETHAARPKLFELDDVASKAYDQIRKLVDPVWLFNFKKPTKAPVIKSQVAPKPGERPAGEEAPITRDELPGLYVPDSNARAQALVSNLNVADVLSGLDRMIREIEAEFPELQIDLWNSTDTASGKALYIAREKTNAKVLARRSAYDAEIVRAFQMALSIGGFRQYEDYEPFTMESFDAGELNMRVADREVFPQNPIDVTAIKKTVWEIVVAAIAQGVDPKSVFLDFGYTEEEIAKLNLIIKPPAEPDVTQDEPVAAVEAV